MLIGREWILSIVIILFGMHAAKAFAIVLSSPSGDHVVTPGQTSYGINLDGVALLGTGSPNSSSLEDVLPLCTGTLITDRHMLSAAHCFDNNGDGRIDGLILSFPFVAAFELPGRDVLIEVNTSTIQLPSAWPAEETDIAILELAEPAPQEIPKYRLYGTSDEAGEPVVLVGYGDTGLGETGIDEAASELSVKRAGLNRYDAIREDMPGVDFLAYDFDSGVEENNALRLTGFESDLGFGADEVLTAPGDSGGPGFINGAIAGVSSFGAVLPEADVDDIANHSWGEVGFDTRVSLFREFILSATNGEALFLRNDYDLDLNGEVNVDDINTLVRQIVAVQNGDEADLAFDLTQDGIVDIGDRDRWLTHAATENGFSEPYLLGDANLDGTVDAQDLNALGQNWLAQPNTWQLGDFNADGTVDVGDLNKLGQNWLASISLAAETKSVPEPKAWCLLSSSLAFMLCGLRQH